MALRQLSNELDWSLTDYSTISGLRLNNFLEIPRILDERGKQRMNLFTFQLTNDLEYKNLREGQTVVLKENGLEDYWIECLKNYEEFEGWDVKPIKYIVRHISNSEYSRRLYPGTSMMRLLISKPTKGRLNFTQSLKIDYNQDNLKQQIRLIYTEGNEEKYSDFCEATEGIDAFEDFIKWRKW
jgi:hypothetical protein